MKINIERLIGVVQEHFDNEQSYITESKKKPQWKRTQEEDNRIRYYERNQYGTSNEVRDLCEILNLDMDKLYIIARLARKWEKKHDWQKCFPAQDHEQQIMKYLEKYEPFTGPYINYIQWNINHKAEKAAQKAA